MGLLSGWYSTAPAAGQAAKQGSKTLYLQRHGRTEMNAYLERVPYEVTKNSDPGLYDTRLTPEGREGAQRSASLCAALQPKPELLVVSPLTRALHTAELAWLPHYNGPVVVEPLARERVWLSSDVGRQPADLQQDFKHGRYDFSTIKDEYWWWHGGTRDPKHVSLEPEDLFRDRVEEFRTWLLDRPERVIAVVAHWGLLWELTGGGDFNNCELRTFELCGKTRRIRQLAKHS